jgi:hypothetical protein
VEGLYLQQKLNDLFNDNILLVLDIYIYIYIKPLHSGWLLHASEFAAPETDFLKHGWK